MNIENKTILITGANRGIGRTLVEEALKRGAERVYAGMRRPLLHSDGRVTPLTLDVTKAAQIQGAVENVGSSNPCHRRDGLDGFSKLPLLLHSGWLASRSCYGVRRLPV